MTIRNPIEWSADGVRSTAAVLSTAVYGTDTTNVAAPRVQRITVDDLGQVLRQGWTDFLTYRTDVLFLCLIYPLAGLVVANLTFYQNLIPLLFPVVSGFALIGPFAAAGLYEMSRRRERGEAVSWIDAFGAFCSQSIGAIVKLALLMTGVFALWLATAMGIYHMTFGSALPDSFGGFAIEVLTTGRGLALILVGGFAGFLFALFALATSVVSFPLLLDKPVSVATAVTTSFRAVRENLGVMLTWGFIVAVLLGLGALPALLGMIVVMPVLGHATWHLYRRVVAA